MSDDKPQSAEPSTPPPDPPRPQPRDDLPDPSIVAFRGRFDDIETKSQ